MKLLKLNDGECMGRLPFISELRQGTFWPFARRGKKRLWEGANFGATGVFTRELKETKQIFFLKEANLVDRMRRSGGPTVSAKGGHTEN